MVAMPTWERFTILGAFVAAAVVAAKLVDVRMRRGHVAAGTVTRYRVLRRTIVAAIVFFALLAGLLVIPQVRSIAGAILASGAVLGLILGFAAQRPLSNFAAGILIALTQPLRIGDRIEFEGGEGVVEEIRLTHTFVRADDDSRLVIPNDKLASDTIRNSTIVERAQRAEITVQVPLSADLDKVLSLLREVCEGEQGVEAFVSDIDGSARITLRAVATEANDAERLGNELRLRAHQRLRAAGVYT
jgi:small-conductance mechanosensitive channel